MDRESYRLINDVNKAIIQCRGVYSAWSSTHGISYHEMLVLYTIREYGYCTQKLICDSYILPKQTIHNVISAMRENGTLVYDAEKSKGREMVAPDKKTLKKSVKSMFFMVQTRCEVETIKY